MNDGDDLRMEEFFSRYPFVVSSPRVMLGVYSTMQVDEALCIQTTFQNHTVIQFAAHTVMLMIDAIEPIQRKSNHNEVGHEKSNSTILYLSSPTPSL